MIGGNDVCSSPSFFIISVFKKLNLIFLAIAPTAAASKSLATIECTDSGGNSLA